MPKPSIGRIVHYFGETRTHPAIITKVHGEDTVDLVIFDWGPGRVDHPTVLQCSVIRGSAIYHWQWPPREGE